MQCAAFMPVDVATAASVWLLSLKTQSTDLIYNWFQCLQGYYFLCRCITTTFKKFIILEIWSHWLLNTKHSGGLWHQGHEDNNLHNHMSRGDSRGTKGRQSTAGLLQPGAGSCEDPSSPCGGSSLDSIMHRGHITSHEWGRVYD